MPITLALPPAKHRLQVNTSADAQAHGIAQTHGIAQAHEVAQMHGIAQAQEVAQAKGIAQTQEVAQAKGIAQTRDRAAVLWICRQPYCVSALGAVRVCVDRHSATVMRGIGHIYPHPESNIDRQIDRQDQWVLKRTHTQNQVGTETHTHVQPSGY